jgi:hypothetical protein
MVEQGMIGHSPIACVMAFLTRRSQSTFMYVTMAVKALAELDAGILHVSLLPRIRIVRNKQMTLVTANGHMLSYKNKLGAIMFKFGHGFPRFQRVAVLAKGRKLAAVFISVTRCAFLVQSEECPRQILLPFLQILFCHNVFGLVAGPTIEGKMLAFEAVSGKQVVKFRHSSVPENQIVISALMLDMAVLAFREFLSSMHPRTLLKALVDFNVANQTLVSGYAF